MVDQIVVGATPGTLTRKALVVLGLSVFAVLVVALRYGLWEYFHGVRLPAAT